MFLFYIQDLKNNNLPPRKMPVAIFNLKMKNENQPLEDLDICPHCHKNEPSSNKDKIVHESKKKIRCHKNKNEIIATDECSLCKDLIENKVCF